ncbi:unnamed protein product [Auanema sp. JU1783]|nr:unnamed protein product [Auanema sp. JU1783]
MSRPALALLLVFFVFPKNSDALRCQVMNTIQGISTQDCPAHIFECMKFVCRVGKSEQIFKGCNDNANPPISYSVLQQNCANMGGNGQQYLCRYELCNSSPATSILSIVSSLFIFKFLL